MDTREICGVGIEMPFRRLLTFDHDKLVNWEKAEDDFDTMRHEPGRPESFSSVTRLNLKVTQE